MARLNPKTRLTILIIATSGFLAFLGTLVGTIWLASFWGFPLLLDPALLSLHPHIQLYGFIYLFIIAVSYALIPRFTNRAISPRHLPVLSISFFLAGLISLVVLSLLGYILMLIGSILYTIVIIRLIRRPSGHFALSDYYMIVGALLFPSVIALILMSESSGNSGLNLNLLQLSLLGFPTFMIFGVEQRTLHFRGAQLRKRECMIALGLLGSASLMSGLETFLQFENISLLRSAFYLVGGLMFIIALQIFENPISPVMARMNRRDKKRYVYFTNSLRVAFLWLIIGLVFGVIYESYAFFMGDVPFAIRDSFIHSLSVGFIGSTIIAYVPILLPSILSRSAPSSGLSLWPLFLVNAGNILRIFGVVFLVSMPFFWPAALAGPLILAGMIYFMLMIHKLRSEKSAESQLVQLRK